MGSLIDDVKKSLTEGSEETYEEKKSSEASKDKEDEKSNEESKDDSKEESKESDEKSKESEDELEGKSKEEVEALKKRVDDLNKALFSERSKRRELPKDESKEEFKDKSVDIDKRVKEEVDKQLKSFRDSQSKNIEQQAQMEIYKKYPELSDDKIWAEVVSYYTPKFSKDSLENEIKNIQLAVSAYETISGNKLSSEVNSMEKAKNEGIKEGLAGKASADLANSPNPEGRGKEDNSPKLDSYQKEVVRKGRLSEKEYDKYSKGEYFELPIHN